MHILVKKTIYLYILLKIIQAFKNTMFRIYKIPDKNYKLAILTSLGKSKSNSKVKRYSLRVDNVHRKWIAAINTLVDENKSKVARLIDRSSENFISVSFFYARRNELQAYNLSDIIAAR